MSSIPLTQELRIEYQTLFNTCRVREENLAEIDAITADLHRNRSRYLAVGQPLGIPWHVIAVIHNMESSRNFQRHLHNGDPLTARTVRVPKGRPATGAPPFTWEESARDALTYQRFQQWKDWSLPGILYKLEEYNGWGYRLYHAHVLSPYLWSFSYHYRNGRYVADGRWSESAISRQAGAAVLLRRLAQQPFFIQSDADALATFQDTPSLAYSTSDRSVQAERLQTLLNAFPGISLRVDGYPGQRTSDAFKVVFGQYLHGDPRQA
jgi:lysozyme family protein